MCRKKGEVGYKKENYMAKNYGGIPCVNIRGEIHITTGATKCLCGASYRYGQAERDGGKANNLIWREFDAVTCKKCKEKWNKER